MNGDGNGEMDRQRSYVLPDFWPWGIIIMIVVPGVFLASVGVAVMAYLKGGPFGLVGFFAVCWAVFKGVRFLFKNSDRIDRFFVWLVRRGQLDWRLVPKVIERIEPDWQENGFRERADAAARQRLRQKRQHRSGLPPTSNMVSD